MTTPKLQAAVLVCFACEAANVFANILPGARAETQQKRRFYLKRASIFNLVFIAAFVVCQIA